MITFGLDLAAQAKIERTAAGPDAGGVQFPADPKNGQPFLLTEDFGEYTKGLYVYSEARADWVFQVDDFQPYDIGLSLLKRFKPEDVVASALMARTIAVRSNFEGSLAVTERAASVQLDFVIEVEDGASGTASEIGVIRFEPNVREAKFIAKNPNLEHIIVSGDIVRIKSPATMDYTLRGTLITICAALIS